MEKILVKNDWLEISDNKGFTFVLEKAGYFDERPLLQFYLTSLLGLLMILVGVFTSVAWWYWIVAVGTLLFGRFQTFVHLPIRTGIVEFEALEWGVKYYDRQLWLCLGKRGRKVIQMPWSWKWIRTSKLAWSSIPNEEEVWIHSRSGDRVDFYSDEIELWSTKEPFTYVRENGEEQHTTATVTVGEQEWRWALFSWLPFGPFCRVSRSIWVEFDDPIGEGVGTYKGGVTGTGEDLKEGEHPLEALKRLEQTCNFRR